MFVMICYENAQWRKDNQTIPGRYQLIAQLNLYQNFIKRQKKHSSPINQQQGWKSLKYDKSGGCETENRVPTIQNKQKPSL